MIKNFKIFENSLYTPLKKVLDNSGDIIEEELEKVIGFDKKDYKLDVINDLNFYLNVKEEFFDDFVNVENGVFRHYLGISSNYGGYENYVDESEIEYLHYYFNEENEKLFKRLCELLDVKNDDKDTSLLLALGNNIDTSDILYEISDANEMVIRKEVNKAFDDLPFQVDLNYTGNFDLELELNIHKIIDYIEKKELEDINTIADFLENVDYGNFTYEVENVWESEFDRDFTDTNKVIKEQLENIIDELEEITKLPKPDPNQLTLFNDFEEYEAKYNFNSEIFTKLKFEDLRYAKDVGGKLLAWFKSYLFQKPFMDNSENKLFDYKRLESENILNPEIEKEYGHLVSAEKYNM